MVSSGYREGQLTPFGGSGDAHLIGSPKLLEYLGLFLQWHVTPPNENALLRRLAQINVGSNVAFDMDSFPPDVQEAIREGVESAHRQVEERGNQLGTTINGWEYAPPMGTYGEDYLFRSAVAWKFMYTNNPEEALYPIANTDALGDRLTGAKNYILHFEPGQQPPVDAFWSITMYHAETRLMVHNPIARYSIGDRTKGIHLGDDGSLTIYIQHQQPQGDQKANWLPSPEGEFYLIARAYMPKQSLLDGTYRLSSVTPV